MPMTPLTGLDRTSSTFRADLDTFFLTKLPAFVGEANALVVEVEADRVAAAQSVTDAATQVSLATAQTALSAGFASNSADSAALSQNYSSISAANAAFNGEWASLTGALTIPASVHHDNKYWALLTNLSNVATATPGVSASWGALGALGPGTTVLAYDSRATLRSQSPRPGDQAIVEGLGLFVWASASTEPDDDESAFATASGVWLLQAAAWDLIDAWQAPDQQALADDDEDEPTRFASSFASSFASKVITTTYTNTVTSVGPNVTTAQIITVVGASVGDAVLVTRSGTAPIKPEGIVYGVVTAINTVTVYYANPTNAITNYYLTTGTWRVTVIKP